MTLLESQAAEAGDDRVENVRPVVPNPSFKASLVEALRAIIRNRGLTQKTAGQIAGLRQSDLSALLRGRLAGMSIDRLVRTLVLLGAEVSIEVSHDDLDAGKSIRISARP